MTDPLEGDFKLSEIVLHLFSKASKRAKINTIKIDDAIVADKNGMPDIMRYFINDFYTATNDSREFLFFEISEEDPINVISPLRLIYDHIQIQGCSDGGLGASRPSPHYCQICKKFYQNSTMLQESWPQYFS